MRTIAVKLTLVMIFMMPWEDAVTIANFGSVTRLVGFIAAGFWLLTALVEGRVRRLSVFHAAVFLFVIWNVMSVFWTAGLAETTMRIRTYVQLFILILIIWNLYCTPSAL